MKEMTIREALEVFGPDLVRAALPSFDNPSCGNWGTCFVGCAMTGLAKANEKRAFDALRDWEAAIQNRDEVRRRIFARCALSDAYENYRPSRADLHAEVTAFLAEHGSHPEPAVFAAEVSAE